MKISIFTDEISRDAPARAIELAGQWGVTHVEVRTFPNGRFPAVPDADLERFTRMLNDAGLTASGVSPGFSKCSWQDPAVDRALAEGLPKACQWAQRWGTNLVSCFAFERDDSDDVPPPVIDILGRMAAVTRRCGCTLILENEAVCWGATGTEAAQIIRQVGSDSIRLCWDPANASMAGAENAYPGEYESVKDLVTHVHLKNVDPRSRTWSLLHEGAVDWPGQLRALAADRYDGFLVIETHLHVSPDAFRVGDGDMTDQESNTLRNLEFVRAIVTRMGADADS